jgi:hypothetical protein
MLSVRVGIDALSAECVCVSKYVSVLMFISTWVIYFYMC